MDLRFEKTKKSHKISTDTKIRSYHSCFCHDKKDYFPNGGVSITYKYTNTPTFCSHS